MVGDSASSAEFFVGIGIVCFLYSMAALLVYLGYMHVYKDSDFGPIFVSIDLAGQLSSRPPADKLKSNCGNEGISQESCRAGVFLAHASRTLWSQRSWSSCGWCVRPPGRRACRMWRTPQTPKASAPRWHSARGGTSPARSQSSPTCGPSTSLWLEEILLAIWVLLWPVNPNHLPVERLFEFFCSCLEDFSINVKQPDSQSWDSLFSSDNVLCSMFSVSQVQSKFVGMNTVHTDHSSSPQSVP